MVGSSSAESLQSVTNSQQFSVNKLSTYCQACHCLLPTNCGVFTLDFFALEVRIAARFSSQDLDHRRLFIQFNHHHGATAGFGATVHRAHWTNHGFASTEVAAGRARTPGAGHGARTLWPLGCRWFRSPSGLLGEEQGPNSFRFFGSTVELPEPSTQKNRLTPKARLLKRFESMMLPPKQNEQALLTL